MRLGVRMVEVMQSGHEKRAKRRAETEGVVEAKLEQDVENQMGRSGRPNRCVRKVEKTEEAYSL